MARRGASTVIFAIGVASAAPAAAPRWIGLGAIEPGQWLLREGDDERAVCVANPAVLLQLGHPGQHCAQVVVSDSAEATEVRYHCPGNGDGRTTVSIETPRLIRVETRGMARGKPFDHDYEGRNVGACGAGPH